MKTFYIARHAKSSWENTQFADHERPLLEKGIIRTKKIAEYLLKSNEHIDLILSSHAVRASGTASIIGEILNLKEDKIQISNDIYLTSIDILLNLLFSVDESVESLMIIGHNPVFTSFANYFMSEEIDWLPTSGVVCIEFDTKKWEDIITAPKRTKFFISPRRLKELEH